MKIRQLSIFLENKPHQLSAICRALADADQNMVTLSLADTSDFGIVRLVVCDVEGAQAALAAKGYAVNVCDVIAVRVPNRPGGLAGVMEILDGAGVNIEYSYAITANRFIKDAVLVFRLSESDKAEAALQVAGYEMLSEKDVVEASK